jgi:1A family penicillin-binding protein
VSVSSTTQDVRQGRSQLARRLRLSVCILASAAAALIIVTYLLLYVVPLPAPPAIPDRPESTKIYDREGRLLYDSAGPTDSHHTYLPLTQIPASLRDAIIATEDAGFYDHSGIDPIAIGRATADNLVHLQARSGASTITQQLARNLYMDERQRASASPLRKLNEMQLALRLERAYSKDEILETYLNRAYFGNLAYGVEAASQTYFAKGARDLDLAESALLAGLLQSPSRYNPLANPDAGNARQGVVLALIVDHGYLSQDEAQAAMAEPLSYNRTPFPIQAPHFVAWVLQQLPDLLDEKTLARGDLRIYTSLDLSLQEAAQAAVSRQVEALREKNVGSGAVVALDPDGGEILAMVGSADYFDAAKDGAVNSALAQRQPGSSIKPVVYAAALERGMTASTPLLDIPTSFTTRSSEVYAPQNYDLTFHGIVPLREALASSFNVPAVRVLQSVGIEDTFRLGQYLGLTSFRNPEAYDLSLTLGGGEVRLLDLTAAYGAFAGGGLRVEPKSVLRIETAKGKKLYEATQDRPRPRVLSAETAYLISNILSDNDARAPGFGLFSALRLNKPAAVKTGTTTDFRDNWTIGYSPDLVVGVWVGNPDGSSMRNVSGVDGAAPIWRDVMLTAMRNKPARAFEAPSGIETVRVCLPSGLLPTPACQRTHLEVFASGTAPTRDDDFYRLLDCERTSVEPCDGRVYAYVPFEAIPWARNAGLDLPPIAPYSPSSPSAAGQAFSSITAESAELRLVSPADGLVLSLSREVRPADQALPIQALPSVPVRYVEILVNGEAIARLDDSPYRFSWPLRQGSFRIQARAVTTTGQEIWSPAAALQVLPP